MVVGRTRVRVQKPPEEGGGAGDRTQGPKWQNTDRVHLQADHGSLKLLKEGRGRWQEVRLPLGPAAQRFELGRSASLLKAPGVDPAQAPGAPDRDSTHTTVRASPSRPTRPDSSTGCSEMASPPAPDATPPAWHWPHAYPPPSSLTSPAPASPAPKHGRTGAAVTGATRRNPRYSPCQRPANLSGELRPTG